MQFKNKWTPTTQIEFNKINKTERDKYVSYVNKSNTLYYLYPDDIKQWLSIFILHFPVTQSKHYHFSDAT